MEKQISISIKQRALTPAEINVLNANIEKYPDLKYVSKRNWRSFKNVFVAELNGQFAGVCVANKLNEWCKLGPIVVLTKFQGKKIANALLNEILTSLYKYKFYITSSNEAIIYLSKKFEFKERSMFGLPLEVYIYLINLYAWLVDKNFWKEYLRKKKTYGLKRHRHFIRY